MLIKVTGALIEEKDGFGDPVFIELKDQVSLYVIYGKKTNRFATHSD
jgi:hypothetical protein